MTEGTAAARIRVLPGSALSLPAPPPPPSQPPPQPVQLVKICVIGDASSGKSSLVDKFLIRKSANQTNGSSTNSNNNSSSGVHWCNASATSNGTFGSALGASLGPSSVEPTSLAEYYKKDIALKKKKRVKNNMQDTHHDDDDDETTCVRAQVWDINVPQSAIINNQGSSNNNISNNRNSPEDTLSSSNSVNSTSSITSSPTATTTLRQQQYNADNDLANLAPLLPLLKRINGIIITCQCPSPPSITIPSSTSSHASYHSQPSNKTNNGDWAELDLLEVQIENWVKFIKSHVALNGGESGSSYNNGSGTNNKNSHDPYKIFVILTFADLAITEYSPKEWMRVSVKMEEICAKFGIYSWRMGTCVCSDDCDVADDFNCDSSVGNDGDDQDHDGGGAENNNKFIVKQQQQQQLLQQQKRQYGLLQRMAQQQQQLMEEMEDSVEALFIDMILVHLDGM